MKFTSHFWRFGGRFCGGIVAAVLRVKMNRRHLWFTSVSGLHGLSRALGAILQSRLLKIVA